MILMQMCEHHIILKQLQQRDIDNSQSLDEGYI